MTDRFDDERRLVVQAVAPATPAGLLEPRRPVACFWSVPRLDVLGQRSTAVAEFEPAVFGLGDGVARTGAAGDGRPQLLEAGAAGAWCPPSWGRYSA